MNIKKNNNLQKFLVKPHNTVLDVMKAINNNWREIAFVEDNNHQIIGSVSDGDIRRGLLKSRKFDSCISEVMTKKFISVGPKTDRAAVLDLMKANLIESIPVLDEQKRLVGIHFLQDLIGAALRPNIAVIMAGGKGTRLRPLTNHCPKPLMKVAGRPILERIILHLVGYGIKKIYISINYLGDQIQKYCGDGQHFGCEIQYLKEKKFLGTGGALSLLPANINEPIIVLNGDLVTQVNIDRLLQIHQKNKFLATMAVKPYQVEIPFGVVKNQKSRLTGLEEKPINEYLINAGIYVINPELLKMVPKNQEFLITELFKKILGTKKKAGIYLIEEDWIDVGRTHELKQARGEDKND